MNKGINKVTLVGNLGKDPEVRYTQAGKAIANLTVATSESWKDQSGQPQEETEWHKVSIFGKLAEIAGEHLRKGSQVYLEGKLKTRKWTNKEGQDQYTTEIVLDPFNGVMQMLGKAQGNQEAQPSQQQNQPQNQQSARQPQQQYQQPQQQQSPQQYQQPQHANGATPNGYMAPPEFDLENDDIPF